MDLGLNYGIYNTSHMNQLNKWADQLYRQNVHIVQGHHHTEQTLVQDKNSPKRFDVCEIERRMDEIENLEAIPSPEDPLEKLFQFADDKFKYRVLTEHPLSPPAELGRTE